MPKYSTNRPRDILVVVTGAGGFIGGNLIKYFRDKGLSHLRAVDRKPLDQWYLRFPDVEIFQLTAAMNLPVETFVRELRKCTTSQVIWEEWGSLSGFGLTVSEAF